MYRAKEKKKNKGSQRKKCWTEVKKKRGSHQSTKSTCSQKVNNKQTSSVKGINIRVVVFDSPFVALMDHRRIDRVMQREMLQ